MNKQSKLYLDKYLSSLSESKRKKYKSFGSDFFCNDEINANLCAKLILGGKKTATCSLKHWYEYENEIMPTLGHLQVVTNWDDNPVCIIETIKVEECRYCDVSKEFAYLEGEGDLSLEWWKKAHWNFFSEECKELNIKPSVDMKLVLENFKVVYQ